LRESDPELRVEVRVVRTTGDRVLDVPLARIGEQGLFTKELDLALLSGEADLAVHSLKDVPTRVPDGLRLAAVLARTDPRDVLILRERKVGTLAALPAGARLGTSSLRRRAQLLAIRPDLLVEDLRGNLNTRLARLDAGEYDAVLLAAAGVLRLGWENRISGFLSPPEWLPAVGQGALALVAPVDSPALERVRPLNDPDTAAAVTAERAFLRAVEGGCQIPVGALAVRDGVGLRVHGLIAALDGNDMVRAVEHGPIEAAEEIGQRLAAELLARGGSEILAEVRRHALPVPPFIGP
jgi:hydroxymethylbilane synthase